MDKELEKFYADLKQSVREMKSASPGRITRILVSPIAEARIKSSLSQSQFANLMGVSVRTLQDWEQGRRQPSGAAKALLKVATASPKVVRKALKAA